MWAAFGPDPGQHGRSGGTAHSKSHVKKGGYYYNILFKM
jgi:hypothetical protein